MTATDATPVLAIDRTRPAIAVVAIHRAQQRNAGNFAVWAGLRDAIPALAGDGVRLAIVTGTGGHFCAGNDIKSFAAIRHDASAERHWMDAIKAAYAAIQAAPFPVIAAIDGSCVGAGCGLALSCDFRVASRDRAVRHSGGASRHPLPGRADAPARGADRHRQRPPLALRRRVAGRRDRGARRLRRHAGRRRRGQPRRSNSRDRSSTMRRFRSPAPSAS